MTDTTRRTLLRALGLMVTGGGVATVAAGQSRTVTVRQGETTREITPLSGDQPVEALYDYRLPEEYTAPRGESDATGDPYYGSAGTTDLQRESRTTAFLYDGPNGLSLVVVHGAVGEDGGSASWDLTVPRSASWLVRDDYYVDAETGERASTNYDRWRVEGAEHRIDWTWGGGATDGGVLGYLADGDRLEIDPRYNDAAALYREYYPGDVTAWDLLSAQSDGPPERISLALDQRVVLAVGSASVDTPTPTPTPTETERPTEIPTPETERPDDDGDDRDEADDSDDDDESDENDDGDDRPDTPEGGPEENPGRGPPDDEDDQGRGPPGEDSEDDDDDDDGGEGDDEDDEDDRRGPPDDNGRGPPDDSPGRGPPGETGPPGGGPGRGPPNGRGPP